MDIHRCRFVPYPASAINALAFSHPSSITEKGKGPPTLRLAVGRANGNIEIWNPLRGSWHQESILRGGKDRSVEGLVWTRDPEETDKNGFKTPGKLRLFSIGYSSAVTEWDLASGTPVRHYSGSYGELWCIAAQPSGVALTENAPLARKNPVQEIEPQYQSIAVGCADGAVVLLSTADSDLQLQKICVRPSNMKARVLSIAFQSRNVVVVGHADSMIRIFDTRSGQQIRQMSLGAGPTGGPKDILIWAVRCLSDSTIVSGDSTGTIRFWDGKNYALLQRIESHKADILDIATSADGETVVSGGMDRRTTVYRRTSSGRAGDYRRWVEVKHQRMHSHDIKAMAAYESSQLSILASGGLDTVPIIIPIQEFGMEHHRSLSSLPQLPPICSAPRTRLVMSWWAQELSIWRLPRSQGSRKRNDSNTESDESESRKLLAKIALKGEDSITSADLSMDGSMIAASTMCQTKLFRLRPKLNNALRVQRIETPHSIARSGARILHFTPDGRWLMVVTTNNLVKIHRVTERQNEAKVLQILSKPVELRRLHREPVKTQFQHGSHGNYTRLISRVAFSADSRILATGDLSGYIDTWVLEGYEDLTQRHVADVKGVDSSVSSDDEDGDAKLSPTVIFGQHWIRNPNASLIPKLAAPPLVLSFRPSSIPSVLQITNGTTAVRPTRHTPHPRSHDLPTSEDRLFALTSEHQMYELEVLSGRLSHWSRRNPTSSLPEGFRNIRDRAMGLVWNIDTEKERLWLYGSSWLWMFDLSKDFPRHGESQNGSQKQSEEDEATITVHGTNKRKRNQGTGIMQHNIREPGKQDAGAGSKISDKELGVGTGRKFRRTDGPELDSSHWVSLDREYIPGSEDDDDDYVSGSALLDLRRETVEPGRLSNGFAKHTVCRHGRANTNGDTRLISSNTNTGIPYWSTYKYRPILGIVPLEGDLRDEDEDGGVDRADDESTQGLEVALIERPVWDLDLPPRYYGDQEWNDQ